jgi:hypothetical protein
MGNNQLKLSGGLRLGNANADLSTPSSGLVYFNTGSSQLRLYDGSTWVSLAVASNEFNDNVFRIRDSADITKKLAFEVDGVTTGTTRTITMPDADVDLGNLTNSNISASAAIAYSKLNLTGSVVNADISASAAIAYSKLNLSGSIVNADVSASAAIAYSKLSLTNSIVNADISSSAAIDYSKLNLANSIVNADVAAGAAIARTKLASGSAHRLVVNDASGVMADAAAITADRALVSDANGIPTHSAVTATELGYVSGVTSSIQTQLNAKANDADVIKKDGSVAFTGDQSMGGNQLTNLGAPIAASDAATKSYVDSVAEGLKPKAAARLASTANLSLSGLADIDGVTPAAGDRILVKDQTAAEDNGIYVAAAGAWSRSTDFDSLSPIDEINGAMVAVQEGTLNAGKVFVQSGTVTTIGTDPIEFVFFNSSASLTGGDGITVSGSNISVDHDGEGLTFVSTQLALELDGATLSKSVTGLKVADAGVTETQLASSVAGSGLAGGAGTPLSVNVDGQGIEISADQLTLELDGSTLSKSASGLKVATGGITNTEVNASAAIDYSKLNLVGSIVNADVSASAAIAYSKLALSNSIVNADISASAAIAYSKLALSNSIVNADISASAAIAYSKLDLSASIVNADISASAAIAYSKLALSNSIVNADIATGAAIALDKLASLTADRALVSNGSGVVSVSAVTATELGYLAGVTSSVQTQLDDKVEGPLSSTDEAIARFDGTTGKLIQNTTNATLSDSGSLTIADTFKRGDSSMSNVVEEEYVHSASLTASTTAVLSSLTYDSKAFKGVQVEYVARNGNAVRTGKILIVNDNALSVASSDVSLFDSSTETAEINLSFSAALNGDNVEVSYTTSSGTYSISMDVKRLKV